jgi:NAD(P)-dependent dehydrogenase (short-subunit alcohol dehydrogenase family)
VLINNAGNDDRHTLDDITEEYFSERLNLNLKHYFFASQAAFEHMSEFKSGSIINLSSVSWIRAANPFSLYATAKSAIIGLTRSLAKEFGKYNIRVNAILPGSIATERQKELWLKKNLKDEILDLQCIKRQLLSADVANLALYLASDVSSGCTKQNFIVDGGLT